MTTVECLTALFSEIDEQMRAIPKHPEAHLWPSEVVTLGLLPARKGVGNRAFYRWLTRDYRPLFPRSDSPGFRGKIFTCCYYWRYFITGLDNARRVSTGNQGLSCPQHMRVAVHL